MARRMYFCLLGSLSVQTTGMGSRNMRKSVIMSMPRLAHHTLWTWQ